MDRLETLAFNPWAALAFYGTFAAFALIGTWGRGSRQQVGVMLMLCWLASNVLWFAFPVEWRPAVFPVLDVLFALTCAKAHKETGSRVPLVLIALAVMAIAASTAFSISGAGSWRQVVAYEITLNIIFVAQCLVTGGWGLADAVGRAFRVGAGPHPVRHPPEPFRASPNDEA